MIKIMSSSLQQMNAWRWALSSKTQRGGIFLESASSISSILESSTSDTYEVLYERLIDYTVILYDNTRQLS